MDTLPPDFTALCEALDDEYKARAIYRAVIGRFGPVLPFANIVHSEQRHLDGTGCGGGCGRHGHSHEARHAGR